MMLQHDTCTVKQFIVVAVGVVGMVAGNVGTYLMFSTL